MQQHLISIKSSLKDALTQLNELRFYLTLFVVDDEGVLKGSITDGDIRRGLLNEINLTDSVSKLMNKNCLSIREGRFSIQELDEIRKKALSLIPVISESGKIIRLLNFEELKSLLPLDVVLMAGGEGSRLNPLTNTLPKSLVKIGDKPILEHNIDRLVQFGIDTFHISIHHLGEQIEAYFGDGSTKKISIHYLREKRKQGTIGALSLLEKNKFNDVLLMNSDILTNIDFEAFYREFLQHNAAISVACFPYQVSIPYATIETEEENIVRLKEKPVLTYYSNAGIYLIKRELLELIPKNTFFEATQFIEKLIELKKKVVYFPILDYWLDIGQMDDYKKAQEDIKHIKL